MSPKIIAGIAVAVGLAVGGGNALLDPATAPVLTIRLLTNAEPMVNPAFSTKSLSTVYILNGDIIVTNTIPQSPDPTETNAPVNIDAKVMCPTAIALRWFGAIGHAYQVQWSTNMTDWISTHTWRIGMGREIEFLGPAEGKMGMYRLNVRASPF